MKEVFVDFTGDLPLGPAGIEDFLHILTMQNNKEVEETSTAFGLFQSPEILERFFTTCRHLQLPYDVKYVAIELFEKYHLCLYKTLHGHTMAQPTKKRQQMWEQCMQKVFSQMNLRVMSCVQVACKMLSRDNVVSVAEIRELCQSLGTDYSQEEIIKSEVRLIATIDFNINVTPPVVYVETLAKCLYENMPDLPIEKICDISLSFLDFVLMNREGIYAAVFHQATGKPDYFKGDNRKKMVQTLSDKMLLASSVVSAGALAVAGQDVGIQVLEFMSSLSRIKRVDVQLLASTIFNSAKVVGDKMRKEGQI